MDREFVLEKLAKKKELDPDLLGFGIARHNYELQPPIKESKLIKLEKEYGISIPEDYRNFLLKVGNGGAGPSYGLYSIEASLTGKKDTTYEYSSGGVDKSIREDFIRPDYSNEEYDDDFIGENYDLFMLCQHGCANDDFLVINGKDRGFVWEMTEGGLIPLLKDIPDTKYLNQFSDKEREVEELKWMNSLCAAKPNEQMTFTDWYTDWLEKSPFILPNAKKRKRKKEGKKWFHFW